MEEGSIEYKQQLLGASPWRLEQLKSQLAWRLAEGGGACTYLVGVSDCGGTPGLRTKELAGSLATLRRVVLTSGAAKCET